MNKRPFIIDCDTGTDDAIMLIAAAGCKEIDIVAITSVNGNVSENFVVENNLDLTSYLGREDIPVYGGAVLPLVADCSVNADASIHGKTGLGDITLPKSDKKKEEEKASDVIYEIAKSYQGELEILVTGPMTNLAITVMQYPDFPKYVKHLYFMGGATIGGNVNSTAEFNIWADPEACQVVLESGIPLTMVGLNVSNLALMTSAEEEKIRSFKSKASTLCADLLSYMINRRGQDVRGARMHDPLALAAAICPECLEFEQFHVECECDGTNTRGCTSVDIFHKSDLVKNVRVATVLHLDTFRNWLISKVENAGKEKA